MIDAIVGKSLLKPSETFNSVVALVSNKIASIRKIILFMLDNSYSIKFFCINKYIFWLKHPSTSF